MSPEPMALTSGVTRWRILPSTSTGSVWASVPPRNCDVITSSSENVRHRSPATTIAGMSSGSVTRRNTRQRLAPRSAAASSSVPLIVEKRACMMIVA